ncbi:hypothetical protein [Neobacillus cucumis]
MEILYSYLKKIKKGGGIKNGQWGEFFRILAAIRESNFFKEA